MRIADCRRCIGQPQAWPTWVGTSHRRRADPLLRVAATAVDDLIRGGWHRDAETGLVVATSYGAVDATWRFGTSILAFGDDQASPTPFTNSVHNSIAGTLGETLGLHGPSTTISQGQHGTCAALRWARLMLNAGRATTVLVVIGDCHNDWSRRVVGDLIAHRHAVGDGVVALLCHADPHGPGRLVSDDPPPADAIQVDAGSIAEADDVLLAGWPGERRSSAGALHAWWPCAALAQVDQELWRSSRPLRIAEAEDDRLETVHLGPWQVCG